MKYITILILVLMIILPVAAQDGQSRDEAQAERTIEELYLSQDLELQIMRSQALANDRDLKRLALRNIRSMVEEGNQSDGMYVILESLATEGTARQIRSEGAVINNFPEIRREATELLGRVGWIIGPAFLVTDDLHCAFESLQGIVQSLFVIPMAEMVISLQKLFLRTTVFSWTEQMYRGLNCFLV